MRSFLLCSAAILFFACSESKPPAQPVQGDRDAGATFEDARSSEPDATAREEDAQTFDDAQTVEDAQTFADAQTHQDAQPDTDPFAPQPDESEGLTNLSSDLPSLLENGALEGACPAYEADPADRRKMLLCGKQMFFYESFGTAGVPELFIRFLGENFPEVGSGWSNYGMVRDPNAMVDRPLGFGDAPPLGNVATLAFTCASCHFSQLSDGRYAIGAPNHRYEYGKQIITVMTTPALMTPNADPTTHHPDAVAIVQPLLDRMENDRGLRLRFLLELLPLLGAGSMAPPLTREVEGYYAHWLSGTQDFIMPPLPIDDGVHTVSKISALWGLPRADEQTSAMMPHAMLGWTGGTPSLEEFLEGFAILGSGDLATWTPDKLRPLAEFIYSLRAPENLSPPAPAEITTGRDIFDTAGCAGCHQGPRGSGVQLYDYEEIGTDAEMKKWIDPDLDGTPCCGFDPQGVTHQLKSPRLTGSWSFGRFLHNGSIPSLEALFCLEGMRGDITEPAFGNSGHLYGCELEESERRSLISFLRSI